MADIMICCVIFTVNIVLLKLVNWKCADFGRSVVADDKIFISLIDCISVSQLFNGHMMEMYDFVQFLIAELFWHCLIVSWLNYLITCVLSLTDVAQPKKMFLTSSSESWQAAELSL